MTTKNVQIGAKVRFRIANRPLVGRVLEDRGPIGRGARHLYVVRYELGKGNWYSTELPAEGIEEIESKPVNVRRRREVDYIIPVDAVDAYSLFARPKHAQLLADFLHSQEGIRFIKDPEPIEGEINFLIEKNILWEEFVDLLNEWKQQYAQEYAASGTTPRRGQKGVSKNE